MIITKALRDTLIDSAKQERDKIYAAYVEAQRTYDWASRLLVGADLTSLTPNNVPYNHTPTITGSGLRLEAHKPIPLNSRTSTSKFTRYYIPSKSGLTQGHYIMRWGLDAGSIDCTCPGFVNRGTCWAVKSVLSNPNSKSHVWKRSISIFETNRTRALNAL